MHVSSSPGEEHHSFFFETCPPFASFVGLPFPVFIGFTRLSGFLVAIFSPNRIIRSSRTRFL